MIDRAMIVGIDRVSLFCDILFSVTSHVCALYDLLVPTNIQVHRYTDIPIKFLYYMYTYWKYVCMSGVIMGYQYFIMEA